MSQHRIRTLVSIVCLILVAQGYLLVQESMNSQEAEINASNPVVLFRLAQAQRVVRDIQAGRIVADPDPGFSPGIARLPGRYATLTQMQCVYITHWTDGTLLVYFPSATCRGITPGYLFSSKILTGKNAKINCGSSGMDQIPLSRKINAHWWISDGNCDYST